MRKILALLAAGALATIPVSTEQAGRPGADLRQALAASAPVSAGHARLTREIPLATDKSDPAVVAAAKKEAVAALVEQAKDGRLVSVIVGFDAPLVPEVRLDAVGVRLQRASMAEVRESILAQMPRGSVGSVRRFETIPYFAAVADADALRVLGDLAAVTSINEDGFLRPIPAGSAWIIQISRSGLAAGAPGFAVEPEAIAERPVIFVHGFCSDSSTWNFYWEEVGSRQSRYGNRRVRLYFDGPFGVRDVETRQPPSPAPDSRFFVADLSWSQRTRSFDMLASADDSSIFQKAGALKAIIDHVKATTGFAEVLLVAHSMGGLVGRAYMQGLAEPATSYGHDAGALITVGTPNLGSALSFAGVNLSACVARDTLNKREMRPWPALSETLQRMNHPSQSLPSPVASLVLTSPPSDGDGIVSAASQNIRSVFQSANAYTMDVDPYQYMPRGVGLIPHIEFLQRPGGVAYVHTVIQRADASLPPVSVRPGAPTLTSQVAGTTVSLWWTAPGVGTPPLQYLLDVGTTPGASDLYSGLDMGSSTSFSSQAPAGTYFIRVRATNAAGTSPPSNEVTVVVGGGGAGY